MKLMLALIALAPMCATAQPQPFNLAPPLPVYRFDSPQTYRQQAYIAPQIAVVPQYRDNLQQQADLRYEHELTTNLFLHNEALRKQLDSFSFDKLAPSFPSNGKGSQEYEIID
jgi:hypothetical protein